MRVRACRPELTDRNDKGRRDPDDDEKKREKIEKKIRVKSQPSEREAHRARGNVVCVRLLSDRLPACLAQCGARSATEKTAGSRGIRTALHDASPSMRSGQFLGGSLKRGILESFRVIARGDERHRGSDP